jgi:hypothetical protein
MKECERASINPQAGAFFRIENGRDMYAEFAVHGLPLLIGNSFLRTPRAP